MVTVGPNITWPTSQVTLGDAASAAAICSAPEVMPPSASLP